MVTVLRKGHHHRTTGIREAGPRGVRHPDRTLQVCPTLNQRHSWGQDQQGLRLARLDVSQNFLKNLCCETWRASTLAPLRSQMTLKVTDSPGLDEGNCPV